MQSTATDRPPATSGVMTVVPLAVTSGVPVLQQDAVGSVGVSEYSEFAIRDRASKQCPTVEAQRYAGFHGRIEADRARDGRLLAVAADERDETGRCPERVQELGDRNLDDLNHRHRPRQRARQRLQLVRPVRDAFGLQPPPSIAARSQVDADRERGHEHQRHDESRSPERTEGRLSEPG